MRHVSVLALLVGVGCVSHVPPPEVDLTGKDPHAAWERVLSGFVDEGGRIDFEGMRANSADLDTFVAWIALNDPRSKPELFATRDEKLAFYINSYNALAMYNVLHSGVLPVDTASFFYFHELTVGGRWISLYHYENDVIRPLGEERVHFALNCMVRACPRLPMSPFTAGELDQQLDRAAREFFNKPLHMQPLIDDGRVRFSQILEFYTDDFLARAPTLIDYANRYLDDPLPATFAVEFIPYDWTLNAQ